MLRAMVMALWSERKGKIVEGDRYNPTKDPPTVKSVFSVEHKDGKLWMV